MYCSVEQNMSMEEVNMFVDEALTMTKFDHEHVLHIVGISFDANSFPMAVLPFMQHGDLLSYIRDEHNVSFVQCRTIAYFLKTYTHTHLTALCPGLPG